MRVLHIRKKTRIWLFEVNKTGVFTGEPHICHEGRRIPFGGGPYEGDESGFVRQRASLFTTCSATTTEWPSYPFIPGDSLYNEADSLPFVLAD